MRLLSAAVTLALLFTSPLAAQAPHEKWRTINTDTFRVHYPLEWEAWTLRTAARLETARELVAEVVGHDTGERIDVVVMDPMAAANGLAWPLLGRPRIVLWTTPPPPESAIGDVGGWDELLIVHETAHILHIGRRSRNPFRRLLSVVLPIGPVANAPRWVLEGYATVVEGELTGGGRPFRDFRATVLRRWAETGRLPGYSQLSSDTQSYMGMSMAYLVGSAYLEWLRDRTSPDALRHLWSRMTARQTRSFDDSFTGVFGDSPQALYGVFRAELTQKARNLRDELEPDLREGELILDLARNAGPIDVSPDGDRIIYVERPGRGAVSLVIRSTEIDEEAVEKRAERIRRLIESDPEDVPPVDPPAAPRKELHRMQLPRGADAESVTFISGGSLVAFTSAAPDDDGVLHSDVYLWDSGHDSTRRLTTRGDVFAISSAAGAARHESLTGIRHRHGMSSIVRVNLADGTIEQLTEPSLYPIPGDVAVAPDGRLAWTESRTDGWTLVTADADASHRRDIPAPDGSLLIAPEWSPDGRAIFVTLGGGGFLEIARVDPQTGIWEDITRTTGGFWSVSAAPGSLYYLSLDPDGLDVRRIEADAHRMDPATRVTDARYAPVVRVPFPTEPPPPLAAADISAPQPYGIGPRELDSVFGGYSSTEADLLEGGVRWGDPIGRFETLLLGGWSGEDERGILFDTRWRGTRAPLSATAWSWRRAEDSPERTGISIGASRDWRTTNRALHTRGAIGWERANHENDASGIGAFLQGRANAGHEIGRLRIDAALSARTERIEAEETSRHRGTLSLEARRGGFGLGYTDAAGTSSREDGFLIGGIASSILPPFEQGAFIEVPALAPGTLVGESFRRQRATLSIPIIPGQLFAERVTARSPHIPDEQLDLAGWNASLSLPAMPLLGLPSLDLHLGLAHQLTEPRPRDLTWWIATRWRL